MDSVKKIWLSLVLPFVIWIASLGLAHWISVQWSRIFFPLFLIYIIFMLKFWFGKEDNLGKMYDDYKKLGLMTILLIALRMQWGLILNAPIGSSLDYFTSLGWLRGTPPLLGVILDAGLILLILYYFTYKKGELLEKVTLWTALGSIGISFIILFLKKYFYAPSSVIRTKLLEIYPMITTFLRGSSHLGIIVILGIAILILGMVLPKKCGEKVVGIGMLILVVCFGIFCYGKVKNFSIKDFVGTDSVTSQQAFYGESNDNIYTHEFYPSLTSLKSELPKKFQIKKVDTSKLSVRHTPTTQRIRQDLPDSAIIFSRTLDFNNPSSWFSLEEVRQKGFCKPIPLYVYVNSKLTKNMNGKVTIIYELI